MKTISRRAFLGGAAAGAAMLTTRWRSARADNPSPLVVVNGAGWMKAGRAGQDAPPVVFPSVVGKPQKRGIMVGAAQKDSYVGNEALAKSGILSLKYPIESGIVTDWDAMAAIWKATFAQLNVSPQTQPILLTQPALNPKANLEKMAQVMFDEFSVPALYVSVSAALALYATGRTTGIVIESGDSVTRIVPIYKGLVQPRAVVRIDLGGRDVTKYLMKLLGQRGYPMTTRADQETARDIKEKLGYVALDFEQETSTATSGTSLNKSYTLPSGQVITLNSERFQCAEILFQPNFLGTELTSLHTTTVNAINKCDAIIHKDLYGNVVLAGGNTLFAGLPERLAKELKSLAPSTMPVKVIAQPQRRFLSWIGGSVLINAGGFQSSWITKSDYDQAGVAIVDRKCL